MARKRAPDFLERLLRSAIRVFSSKGLKRARMSDIATDLGVAQGSLYNYVESKEALFYLLIDSDQLTAKSSLPVSWPIPTPAPEMLLQRLRERIAASFKLPQLDSALRRRSISDARKELAGVIRELYLQIEETREPATVLERSALDLPELYQVFFIEVRRSLLAKLTDYVERRRKSGHFSGELDSAITARFLLETVTFFGRHRYQDPDIPADDGHHARETIIKLLISSLLADGKRASTAKLKRKKNK